MPSGPRNPHVSITASHRDMLRSVIALAAVASSSAFSLLPLRGGSTTPRSSPQMAEIGETGVAFETVAREWRCKYTRALSLSLSLWANPLCRATSRRTAACALIRPTTKPLTLRVPFFYYRYTPGASGGPGDSASLKACQELLTEYLPKLKALPGAEVTRQVCGGCMDFKVSITQPLAEHGAWADADCAPSSPRSLSQPRALVSSTAD